MLFNSPIFIVFFLPLTLLIFFMVGRHSARIAAYWLFLASLVFYAWWNPAYVPLLLGSIVFNYFAGRVVAGTLQQPARKVVLIFSIIANLGLLINYKYAAFLLQVIGFAQEGHGQSTELALPLGISFFTFTQITFLVDAYSGGAKEYRFGHYGLFVTFFPHLIAGPILHHKEMMPQFQDMRTYRPELANLSVGLTLFVIGLFKKVILADGISPYVAPVFQGVTNPAGIGSVEAWLGVMAYSFQLYFDFSGYSDMASGLARMFGIRMPINFYSPYKARSMLELWRRWHMSLSRFLRDYVFVPLGGNRKSAFRRYASLLATMFIGGVWHGAGWTFIVWGAFLGALLALNHAWLVIWRRTKRPRLGLLAGSAACTATYIGFTAGLVFFRADSLDVAFRVSGALIGLGASSFVGTVGLPVLAWIVVCGLIVWGLPNSQQLLYRFTPGIETFAGMLRPSSISWLEWKPSGWWALAISTMAVASLLMLSRVREFLYFAF